MVNMSDINTRELSKSLNELYQSGSYKEAVDLVLKNKGSYTPAIFHEHLGTLYLKNKDFGVARFHLEKAVKKGLVNTNVRHNLKTVKKQITTPDMDANHGFWQNFVSTGLSLPSGSFFVLSLLIIFTSLLLKRVKLIKNNYLAFTFVLLGLLPIGFQKLYLDKISYGVTLTQTPLIEGPSKIYSEITELEPGVKFIIGRQKEGWYLIKFPDNLVGWVEKKNIGIFK